MKFLAILIGKITIFLGKLLHRGSSLPGKLALKLDKNLLSKLEYPKIRIAVTGSSGKGSTSSLIANTLKDYGYKVCFNASGSNLAWGITTSFLKNTNLLGKIKADVLVMETDERYSKKIFKDIKPTHIVITNLTKDQPPRQHNVDVVYNDVLESITKNATIITNMDDPYLRNFEKDTENKIIYYGIAENKNSYKKQIFENLNIYECPYCSAKLEYDYYNFETLGKYHCNNCDFKWIEPYVIGRDLDLENGTLKINNEEVSIGGDMLFHAYNVLASYTTLKTVGLEEKNILEGIKKYSRSLNVEFIKNDKIYKALDCKAENATTYNACVLKVYQDNRKKDVIIGWKEISRRYNHFDVSWLYDIEFELLNNETVNKIYACGIDASNIKKRLILAGIQEEKIVTASNLSEIKEEVESDNVEIIYGILNFDYMKPFEDTFKEKEDTK